MYTLKKITKNRMQDIFQS